MWSYSRTTCFDHCKYEYYLGYVVHDDELYLSEWNFYAEVGSFVHEILAKIITGELNSEDSLDYYLDHFDEYVLYKTYPGAMNKTYESIADYFSNLDLSWLNRYEVVGVEKRIRFKIGRSEFVGILDLLLRDKEDGRLVLMDHKSMPYPFKTDGGIKKNCEKSFSSYKRQMYLYCKAIYDTYGEFPKALSWNHFEDGGKIATIPFSESEYQESIDWFQNSVKRIKKEKDFEPSQDYFYCSNLCNFRNSCEYQKMGSGT